MKKLDAFGIFTREYHQDWDLFAEDFDDLACLAASALSEEQRREVKQLIDGLIKSCDVEEAQRVWWGSRAECGFDDEHIMDYLRRMSVQLGKPDPQPKMVWLKKK